MYSQTTPDASNPVKKDTTTKTGKVNLSPMTPLKGIGGQSVQVLKIDDLRMFCSRNGIKGSRKAKKADICWAICKAKEAYLAGQPAPYKDLMPACDGPEVDDNGSVAVLPMSVQHELAVAEVWGGDVNSDERANKKRRVEDAIGLNAVGLLPPLATALGGINGKQNGNELMILQRRLVRSKEETNLAIQLRETVESAATLRREIREEKDRRASLWKEFVQNVGDESLATTRVKAFRVAMDNGEHVSSGSEVKGSYETLIENVIEQDDLVRQMTMQHAALNRAVDQLITKEKNGASDVAVAWLVVGCAIAWRGLATDAVARLYGGVAFCAMALARGVVVACLSI